MVGNRLMVEFRWEEVADILEIGEDVEVLITGEVNDILYRGIDAINVVDTPPDVPPVTPPEPPAAAPPAPAPPEEEIVVEPEPPAVAEERIFIIMQIDSDRAYVNGEEFLLDVAPFIEPAIDRTLAPVRFVGEKLGASVYWLPETRQVRVKDEDMDILLTINSDTAI